MNRRSKCCCRCGVSKDCVGFESIADGARYIDVYVFVNESVYIQSVKCLDRVKCYIDCTC